MSVHSVNVDPIDNKIYESDSCSDSASPPPSSINHDKSSIPLPRPCWLLPSLLILIPLLSINNFFSYHAPDAIGSSVEKYYNLDASGFALLFTVYSMPNVVLVFFGGMMVDRFGLIKTTLAFNECMLSGMLIFAVAPPSSSYCFCLLLLSHFLLGVGDECLCAAASAMLARWFHEGYLVMAMGFYAAGLQLLGSAPSFLLLSRALK